MNQHKLIDDLLEIARDAGRAIMRVYSRENHGIQEKADNSPLTEADLAAHHIIREGLNRLTPEIPQLSEEGAEIPYSERRNWPCYWLVDPLDGTKEFIRRNDEFYGQYRPDPAKYPGYGRHLHAGFRHLLLWRHPAESLESNFPGQALCRDTLQVAEQAGKGAGQPTP